MAMSMFSASGSTRRTRDFLQKMQSPNLVSGIEALAQSGVDALASVTPVDTGLTASSWSYEIETTGDMTKISWLNTNRQNGINIAIILQYGHGTGNGGYVSGYDYINPALKPIFDLISDEVWKKVTTA